MPAPRRLRRVCLNIKGSNTLQFDKYKGIFQKRFKHLSYISCTNETVLDGEHKCKLFLQFSQPIYMTTLDKVIHKISGVITLDNFDEPYDVLHSWGTFFRTGIGNCTSYAGTPTQDVELEMAPDHLSSEEQIVFWKEKALALAQVRKDDVRVNINNSNITINNNIQVVINNYNNETYSHILPADVMKIVTPYTHQWNKEAFLKLTTDWGNAVYSNPANRNIKCRTKDGKAQVFIDGKWQKHPRREKTIETFHKLTESLKEHGSEMFNNKEITDTEVMLQCVLTGDSCELQSNAMDRQKDQIVCEILERQNAK